MRRSLVVVLVVAVVLMVGVPSPRAQGASTAAAQSRPTQAALSVNPIKHVVIILQENHSFDNVLGPLCVNVLHNRCHGVNIGNKYDGSSQPLTAAADLVPNVAHSVADQITARNAGSMNGFDQLQGCKPKDSFACYTAYQPPQPGNLGFIPNVAALAEQYVVADHTFQLSPSPSWGSHLSFVASQLDGFTGDHPNLGTQGPGTGWGCDSKKDAKWQATPTSPITLVPACVPTPQGTGPYKPSPVKFVPTIFDRLVGAGLNFKLYTDNSSGSGYIWSICPTFAQCLLTNQHNSMVATPQILADTAPGGAGLPSFSIVLPNGLGPKGRSAPTSQHNATLMSVGDNWIGKVVQAIQNDSKDWSSTAVFLTWDDCGCFYDDVNPPAGSGFGIRVPMVIISPFAKPQTTDSTTTSFASVLSFTDHVFSLPPLSPTDANAYDYFGSFNFGATPILTKTHLIQQPVSPAAQKQVQATPADPNDPT
jgi:phospholipase C